MIRIREPFRTRTELFDVGIAGPVAGLIVLIPALFYGFTLSSVVPEPTSGTLTYFGEPLLFQWVAQLVIGTAAAGQHHQRAPGGVGLLVRPVRDGAEPAAVRAARRRPHRLCASSGSGLRRSCRQSTALGLAAMIGLSITWIVPTVMLLAMWRWIGLRHPVPLNPYEPLSSGRRAVCPDRAGRTRRLLHADSDTDRGSGADLGIFRLKAEATPLVFVASGFSRNWLLERSLHSTDIGSTSTVVRRLMSGRASSAASSAFRIAARWVPFTKNCARCSPFSRLSGAGAGPSTL